jgi:nonribosomal peptide synthetase protein BlmX
MEGPVQGFALSPFQTRIWQRSGETCPASQLTVRITGSLNAERLRDALIEVVRRHEILRTAFVCLPGMTVPVQAVGAEALEWIEFQPRDGRIRTCNPAALARAELRHVPDPASGCPLRVLLAQGAVDHVMVLTVQALVADVAALGHLLEQTAAIYGNAPPPKEEPIQQADFAAWHQDALAHVEPGTTAPAPDQVPPVLELERPAKSRGQRAIRVMALTGAVAGEIQSLAKSDSVTDPERHLQAIWAALLSRLTGRREITLAVGTSFDGYEELAESIGPFSEALPQIANCAPGTTIAALSESLGEAHDALEADLEHVALPEEANAFEPGYGFERIDLPPPIDAGDVQFQPVRFHIDRGASRLALVCGRRRQGFGAELHFDTGRFSRANAARIAARIGCALASAAANAQVTVSGLDVLTEADRRDLVEGLNTRARSTVATSALVPVQDRISQWGGTTPEATAVVVGHRRMSFAELDNRSSRLAHALVDAGAGPETMVPVCMARTPELVVAVLAILKFGAAFVPMDPGQPKARLIAILDELDCPVVLADAVGAERIADAAPRLIDPSVALPDVSEPPLPAVDPDNLAYVIHTSGSTGRPKGVMISHAALATYIDWCVSAYEVAAGNGALLHGGIGVDLAVTSLFAPLAAGRAVFLAPEETGPDALAATLKEMRNLSFLKLTPGQLTLLSSQMPDTELVGRARRLILGGEQLLGEDLEAWRRGAPETRVVNEFGPTEATVGCVVHEGAAGEVELGPVPIGRPITGARVYVLDPAMRLQPEGVAGELYIGGEILARGYVGQPGLTAASFVPDPFGDNPGGRLYRTGDMARVRGDKTLEYLGRADDQVKVRGYRVEPGEVEAALRRVPGVVTAAVVAQTGVGPRDTRLVAHVVCEPGGAQVTVEDIRATVSRHLPDHMVPAVFLLRGSLPVTNGGKIDRRALAASDQSDTRARPDYAPPERPEEEALAAIWSDVLGAGRVGIDDNYFELGGDSIRSIQVVARAKARGLDFTIADLFAAPTVRTLCAGLRTGPDAVTPAAPSQPFDLIAPRDRDRMPDAVEDAYPLSLLQGGMLFHRADRPGSAVYHDIFSLHLRARIDLEAMRDVIAALIDRHPALRTSFDVATFSEPLQLVHRTVPAPLGITDLTKFDDTAQDAAISNWIVADKARGFDPEDCPLVRFHIHLRAPEKFQFSGSFHHSIIDGWSDAVMITEIFEDYFTRLAGTASPPSPPLSMYRDFIAMERAALASDSDARFWTDLIEGYDVSTLPRDQHADPASAGHGVDETVVQVPADVVAGLKQAALGAAVPLKSMLLAAHLRVLSLLTGQRRVMTCLVSSGRPEHEGGERVLGLFLNSVPFPVSLESGSWSDLAIQCFRLERRMLPHRRYPMAEIRRRQGGMPLSESLFYFTSYHIYQGLERFDAELISSSFHEESSFPLVVNFRLDPFNGDLHLDLQTAPSVIGYSRADTIGGYYLRALAAIAADPAAGWAEADLLARDEWARLASWARAAPAPEAGLVPVEVAAAAARAPDAPALLCDGEAVRYAALEARANGVARALRAAGAGPETPVGAYLGRGPEMVAGLLGALRCGAAVVPLDPAYPAARLRFMLADAGVAVAVSERALANRLAGLSGSADMAVVLADEVAPATSPPEAGPGRENLAYVIYTSGSTGRPKGVMLRHGALADLIGWARQRHDARDRAGVLASTSISFDLSLFELFLPLASGGTAILAPDALALATLADRDAVRLVNTVPSAIAELLRQGAIPDRVRTINLAGEPLRRDLVAALLALPGVARVQDLYGPSEDTTYSTAAWRTATGPETIGQPIAGTRAQLLDAMGAPVPPGTAGEICLGGAGLARGYLGQPGLTAARFLPDPTGGPGARLYRTGDLGRHLPDGQLEYLGRIDHQIKLRGYRIELGEIEAALAAHPQVAEAAAVARDSATGRQVIGHAALKPDAPATKATAPTPETLRQHLAERLPRWMLPARILLHDALPRTPNGKLDRKSLPDPDTTPAKQANGKTRPKSDTEVMVAGIWCDALGLSDIGGEDNFYELGGHSIAAVRVLAQIEREIGVIMTPDKLGIQNLRQFASTIESRRNGARSETEVRT